MITLYFLGLILSATSLSVVHGPVTNSLGGAPFKMMMSPNAKWIAVTFSHIKDAEVLVNNG